MEALSEAGRAPCERVPTAGRPAVSQDLRVLKAVWLVRLGPWAPRASPGHTAGLTVSGMRRSRPKRQAKNGHPAMGIGNRARIEDEARLIPSEIAAPRVERGHRRRDRDEKCGISGSTGD